MTTKAERQPPRRPIAPDGFRTRGGLLGLVALIMLAAATTAQARVEVEAVVGTPFGIGRITAPIVGTDVGPTRETYAFSITDPAGRIRYPVFTAPPLGRLLSGLFGGGQGGPVHTTVFFLFVGEAPLSVTLHTPVPQTYTVVPAVGNPRRWDRLRSQWLDTYLRESSARVAAGDYPPDAEAYLSAMLSRRLGGRAVLPLPPPDSEPSEMVRTLQLLAGSDRLRLDLIAESFAQAGPPEAATLPPPVPLPWRPTVFNGLSPEIPVEAIASVVPNDCFYVRFGTFENYLWLDRLVKEYGGDVARLSTLRGQALPESSGPAAQLALKQDDLTEIFGPQVISDVALVGYDLFLQEGPALGVIFEAKNERVLKNNFERQRREILEAQKAEGATMETVSVAGQEVSFLATPDHRLRSFYAVRGKYHLHTNCRALVESFLTVGTEAPASAIPLAVTDEFRHARLRLPLERDDTIFAYLSTAFLQRLVDHPTQIELRRRTLSLMELRMLRFARLAARAEGLPTTDVPSLVAAGLLPDRFGLRSDGSAIAENAQGVLGDTIRGYPGTFLPIPDVPPTAITATENARARSRDAFCRASWPEMDPIMVGLKRYALNEDETLERVVIDGDVSPLREEKWAFLLSLLGPPTNRQIPPIPGELVHVEAAIRGGLLFPDVPEHTMVLGILDAPPAMAAPARSIFGTLAMLQGTPGYLAAWPAPHFLDRLTFGLAGRPDPAGYTNMLFGLTRWQGDGFSVLSFQRPVVDLAAATLHPALAERPAQIRIAIGDLAGSNLSGWIEGLYTERARQTTVGNVRMMHLMAEQFRLDRTEARSAVEQTLGTRLVDPLQGDYRAVPVEGGLISWQSTTQTDGAEELPPPIPVEPLPASDNPVEQWREEALPLPPDEAGRSLDEPQAEPIPTVPPVSGRFPDGVRPETLRPQSGFGGQPPFPAPQSSGPIAGFPVDPSGAVAPRVTTVPILAWLRGFSAELTHLRGEVIVHAELTISRSPRERAKPQLPEGLLPDKLPSWKDFVPRSLSGFGGGSREKTPEQQDESPAESPS